MTKYIQYQLNHNHIVKNIIKAAIILCFWVLGGDVSAQCTTGVSSGTITPTTAFQTVSLAAGAPSYLSFAATAGITYTFSLCTADGATAVTYDSYLTLANNTPASLTTSDDVCDGDDAKIVWTATATGTFRIYVSAWVCANRAAATTLRYKYDAPYNPCSPTAGTLSCNTNVTASFTSGQNAYNPPSTTCGFSTPGQERIYTFTPATTGAYTITQASSSVGYVDYFFKAVSGGCSGTGWTCIDDLTGASSSVTFNLTGGVQYYIMADPEASSTGTAVFQVTCPSPPACATYTSPAAGATGVDPTLVTLVWGASAGATSYDIYFGTASTPPLFTNTTATSFSITGMVANTTYYWQIRPKNASGAATGCAIRSFTTGNTVNMQNLTNGAAYMCSGNFHDSGGSGAVYTASENRTVTFYPATAGQMVQMAFSLWDVENNFDYIRIYDGTSTAAPQITTLPTTGTVSPAPIVSASNASGALTINFTSDISVQNAGWAAAVSCCLPPTSPAAGTFGSNQWNVYCYKGNNLNLTGVTYKGYYTETAQSFDTGTRWSTAGTPSSASGYTGCAVEYDYHTVVSKRQGFTPGHYSLSIPTHDDDIRVYVNGTQVFEHVGCCDAHNNFWCGYLDGTSTIEVRHAEGVGGSQQALTLTSTGNPATYGTNQWNIYTYAGYNLTTYYGSATNTTATEFNLGAYGMGVTSNPSTLSGYIGCNPGNDNWSISAKRQGFPCATYNVNLVGHDDEYILNIDFDGNGTVDFTSTAGCCNSGLGTKWTGVLSSNSRVEIVLKEGTGDAYIDIDFVNVTTALQGGAIAGITDGVTICTGTDPGAFTSTAAASAGTSAAITGGTSSYQWESSTTNATSGFGAISGQTSITYDPGTLTQTTWFRRRVTDACGTVAYSNVIQVVVIPQPVVTITGSPSNGIICDGGTCTLTANVSGGTGCTTYQWQFWNGTSWQNTGSGLSTLGAGPTVTRDYRVIVTCAAGSGCTATSAAFTITINPDPVNPTLNAKTPNSATVCAGTSVSATFNAGTGGVGCTDEYQYRKNGGTWLAYTAGTNITTTTGDVSVEIQGRRAGCSSGLGCSANAYTLLTSWTVNSLSVAPTGITGTTTICDGASTTLTVTGGTMGTGAVVEWFAGSCGGTSAGTGNSITVSPSSTTTYFVRYNGTCNTTTCASATVTVQPNHTLTLSSGATTQTVCQSTAISPIVYAVGGGGTSAGVTGLPSGVTGNFASGNFTISGTPTQSGTFSYTVTTTGNGCTVATATGTITVHAPLVLTPGGTNASCNGGTNGTASVSASGGTGSYTYSWYSGGAGSSITNLAAGTYTVLVTSGACSATTSYTVTQPSAITGSAGAGTILCNGGTTTLTVTASGGTGALQYSLNGGAYQSSNSFTVGAGTHTITVKDANNCTQALTAVGVSQPSALVATTCTNANDVCQVSAGQIKVVVSGGVAPYSVAWSPTHGSPSSPQSIGASGGFVTISNLQGGVTYTFVVTDANGCIAP